MYLNLHILRFSCFSTSSSNDYPLFDFNEFMDSLIFVKMIISVEKVRVENMLGLDAPWISMPIYLLEHSILPKCPLMILYSFLKGPKIIYRVKNLIF